MGESGGELAARFLERKGVGYLFTLCGGHVSPILVAARRRGIRVVDVRHEATAVFAADAAARLTGRPSVAVVTAGPGVTNTLTALQNARMAQSPLVLIGGAAPTVLRGRGALQDIDQIALLRPIVKKAFRPRRNCDLLPMLEAAFETAGAGVPGPVFVECPIDLLYPQGLVRKWYGDGGVEEATTLRARLTRFWLRRHVDRMFTCDTALTPVAPPASPRIDLPLSEVRAAAGALAAAQRPVLIVGSQALLQAGRAGEIAAAVAALGAPVYLTGTARGLLGPAHGLQMRHRRREALRRADLVVLAGMPADFRLGYGRAFPRRTVLVGANRSRKDLRLNRKPDIGLRTDPGAFLTALAAASPAPPGRWAAWREELGRRDRERDSEIRRRADRPVDRVHPLHLLLEVDRNMGPDSLVVADGGDFVASAAYVLRPRSPLSWLDPGVFGTLGVGAGFALGAALARPSAETWLIYGDGAAGYSVAEFDTFVRHRVPLVAVVGNDASWAQIARDQVAYLEDDTGTVLRRSDYHTVASGFGGRGLLLDRTDRVGPVLAEARRLASEGHPVLVNAHLAASDFRRGSLSM